MITPIKTKYFYIFFLLFIFIFSPIQIFTYENYSEKREQHIKNNINSAKQHYDVTYQTFKNNSEHFYNSIVNNKFMMSILKDANSKDINIKNAARSKLKKIFNSKYQLISKLGIDLVHFQLKNNESFFRRHTQDNFGDNLKSLRDTVVNTNKYKKMHEGLEVGVYNHAFRFVYPIINSKNNHLGSVEGSVTSSAFMDYFERALQLHTHFIIRKDAVDINNKVLLSNYVEGEGLKNFLRLKKVAIKDFKHTKIEKQDIKKQIMSVDINSKKPFYLTARKNGIEELVIFLPIVNQRTKENIAFFVVYDDKNDLSNIKNIYIQQSIIEFIISLLFAYLIGKIITSRKNLKIEVENKTKELKDLNKNLATKVKEQTVKIQSSLDIISSNVIFSRTDNKGIIIDVSDAFCDISGYSKDELIGHPHNIVRSPDMNSIVFQNLWKTIKSGEEWTGELKNQKKDGSYYWVTGNVLPEFDKEQNIVSYISVRQDITNKKDFEKQHLKLLESEKLASLGEMIGNIAHQWRQPLSFISTVASGISVDKEYGFLDIETLPNKMDSIVSKTEYLSGVIDTFRNYLMENKEYKEVILQDRIDISIKIISAALKDNNIRLEKNINYNEPIKFALVVGELDQVIINLINNAKDILLSNKVENPFILLSLKKSEDEKLVVITVEDNGGGIPSDVLPKIFEPYFTTKHKSQGTGLGLHMSYNIINESLKGRLYATNTEIGAKFTIELPID